MIFGFRSNWRFGRRSSAARRAAARFAAGAAELGAWRRPPQAATTTSLGNARPSIAATAIAPPLEVPAANPGAAEIVVERGPVAYPGVDLGSTGQLVEQLHPACRALGATAFASTARRGDRLILVCSPSADQGTSLTAVHLALALGREEAGRPVLLVDGDVDGAGAARALAWPPQPGLSEVLAGEVDVEEVIRQTAFDNLSLLPPGGPLTALPDLLIGRRLAEVLRALLLRQPAGLVVIDAPPLLSGIAAAALAAHAGQVVLLIAAGRTTGPALDDGLKRLGERNHLHCIFAWPASALGGCPATTRQVDVVLPQRTAAVAPLPP